MCDTVNARHTPQGEMNLSKIRNQKPAVELPPTVGEAPGKISMRFKLRAVRQEKTIYMEIYPENFAKFQKAVGKI